MQILENWGKALSNNNIWWNISVFSIQINSTDPYLVSSLDAMQKKFTNPISAQDTVWKRPFDLKTLNSQFEESHSID